MSVVVRLLAVLIMGPSLSELSDLVVTANLLLGIAAVLWLVSYGVSKGLDRIAERIKR